jgi:hypothetical protein
LRRRFHNGFLDLLLEQPCGQRSQLVGAAAKELARGCLALNRDVTRVMNRLKALYRGWAISCTGRRVYAPRYRSEWLGKITERVNFEPNIVE